MPPDPPFQEVEHTADRAFHVRGRDLAELFARAAEAMFALQGVRQQQPATVTREVELSAVDRESLLVDWLNELLYLQETHRESYFQFDVEEISDTRLLATIRGAPEHESRRIIKAVTFHDLAIQQTGNEWKATVVVDV